MHIALIPARGGSKRIPRKNIRLFRDRPILAYPLDVARRSGLFNRILVSTEDEEIAAVARTHGAEIPFMRPPRLADDFTTTVDVVLHALDWAESTLGQIDSITCIYATAPFLRPDDLCRGMNALASAPAALSLTSYGYPIHRSLVLDEHGLANMLWPESYAKRSQELPEAFHDAAQFYIATPAYLRTGGNYMDGRAAAIRIPRHRVQDIDTMEDWVRAEILYEILQRCGELG